MPVKDYYCGIKILKNNNNQSSLSIKSYWVFAFHISLQCFLHNKTFSLAVFKPYNISVNLNPKNCYLFILSISALCFMDCFNFYVYFNFLALYNIWILTIKKDRGVDIWWKYWSSDTEKEELKYLLQTWK